MAALEGCSGSQNSGLAFIRHGSCTFCQIDQTIIDILDKSFSSVSNAAYICDNTQGLVVIISEESSLIHAYNWDTGLCLQIIRNIRVVGGKNNIRISNHDLLGVISSLTH